METNTMDLETAYMKSKLDFLRVNRDLLLVDELTTDECVRFSMTQIKDIINLIPNTEKIKWNQHWKLTTWNYIEVLAYEMRVKETKILQLIYTDLSKEYNINLKDIKNILISKGEYNSNMSIMDIVGQCAELRESFNKSLNDLINKHIGDNAESNI